MAINIIWQSLCLKAVFVLTLFGMGFFGGAHGGGGGGEVAAPSLKSVTHILQ